MVLAALLQSSLCDPRAKPDLEAREARAGRADLLQPAIRKAIAAREVDVLEVGAARADRRHPSIRDVEAAMGIPLADNGECDGHQEQVRPSNQNFFSRAGRSV